jgi:hypothetical protein
LQQREQRILKKLAEAREAQASSMTRFIQARARVMQVETRLQTLRSSLNITPAAPVQPAESSPQTPAAPTIADARKPASTPVTEITSQPGAPAQAADLPTRETAASTPVATPSSTAQAPKPLTRPARPQFRQPAQFAEQETPLPAFDDAPLQVSEDEDEDETKKMPSLRSVQPVSATKQAQDDDETLIIALSALTRREQSEQSAADEARETGATDITTKIPVIRREHGKPQEQT